MLVDNRDLLSNDVQKLMASTAQSFPLLADMFKDTRSKEERAKRPPTAGQQFRQSVGQLIEVLSECQPHYVRTIKPNDQKKVGAGVAPAGARWVGRAPRHCNTPRHPRSMTSTILVPIRTRCLPACLPACSHWR
jgi:hypothetical protein